MVGGGGGDGESRLVVSRVSPLSGFQVWESAICIKKRSEGVEGRRKFPSRLGLVNRGREREGKPWQGLSSPSSKPPDSLLIQSQPILGQNANVAYAGPWFFSLLLRGEPYVS